MQQSPAYAWAQTHAAKKPNTKSKTKEQNKHHGNISAARNALFSVSQRQICVSAEYNIRKQTVQDRGHASHQLAHLDEQNKKCGSIRELMK